MLKRYKRFLADVQLDTGEVVTAHCANTGPMKGVLNEGGLVRLRYCPSPTRKLSWSWEQAQVINDKGSICWVGVNTSLANSLVRKAIEANYLFPELGPLESLRAEVPYGRKRSSRIDFLLEPSRSAEDSRKIYVEVKNTTWTQGSLALFPDTITKRGQKHLRELMDLLPDSRSVLIPCVSRDDVDCFAPGDSADKQYGDLFREAIQLGLQVIPCCFGFYLEKITWEGKISFHKHQKMN